MNSKNSFKIFFISSIRNIIKSDLVKRLFILQQLYSKNKNPMNFKQFTSLSIENSKVLLYLTLVAQGIFKFNLTKLRSSTDLNNKEIFKVFKYLEDFKIISFIIDPAQGTIFLQIFNTTIDLLLFHWTIPTLIDFNSIVFSNNPEIMHYAVNQLYRNLGKYDETTMRPFFDSAIAIVPIPIPDETKKARADKKERSDYRRLRDEKVKNIVDIFYTRLQKNIPIVLTEKLRKIELMKSKEFIEQYPEFPTEYIDEGIQWFLNHIFWGNIITNISLLTKHFPKFLAQKGIKKTKSKIKFV